MLNNPHDRLFKAVFSRVEHATDLMRSVLPPLVVEELELGSMTPEPANFVDDKLQERFSDLLYGVVPRGSDQPAYVLIEHKSRPEVLTAFTASRYAMDILTAHVRDSARNRTRAAELPLVIPLIVHHGPGGWTAPTSLHELYRGPARMRQELRAHLVGGQIVLYDVARESDAALRSRGMNPLATLALWALAHSRTSANIAAELAGVRDLVRGVLERPGGLGDLALILRYIMDVCDTSLEAFERFLDHELDPGLQEAYMTIAERIRQEAIAKERPHIEQEVAARVSRARLYEILEARGLDVSDAVRARIDGCRDPDTLARWHRRAATASSAEEALRDG